MKKIFLILVLFFFVNLNAHIIKGGVSMDYIPKGFCGS